MKYGLVISMILFVAFGLNAQIKGNGSQKTMTIQLSDLKELDVQFNANIGLFTSRKH